MAKFLVEFGFGENVGQVQEWQTIDGLDEVEADSAESAAEYGANTDGLEGALFRVWRLVENEFGELEKNGDAEYFSFEARCRLDLEQFIKSALQESGVQNDDHDVWVVVDGEQYTIAVNDVLGRDETEPFEASYALEWDTGHEAWDLLYEQYKESLGGVRFDPRPGSGRFAACLSAEPVPGISKNPSPQGEGEKEKKMTKMTIEETRKMFNLGEDDENSEIKVFCLDSGEKIGIGSEIRFSELWDGEGDGVELLESGAISPDNENVVAFSIVDGSENVLYALIRVTDIY